MDHVSCNDMTSVVTNRKMLKQDAPMRHYMEWRITEMQSIVRNGPHRVVTITSEHGHPLIKVAEEEQKIATQDTKKAKWGKQTVGGRTDKKGNVGRNHD